MSKKPPKLPRGWRPGRTPEFKPHPSVVRYRDPDVRTWVNLGLLDGHTHARFVANPDCCSLCAALDGRMQRVGTVSNWTYVLPHINCLCHWETGYMDSGEFAYERSSGEKGLSLEVLDMCEAEFMHEPDLLKAETVVKVVPVHRQGKTFYQKHKVRVGDEEPKTTSSGPKLSPERLKALSVISADVKGIEQGTTKNVRGVAVTSLKDGFYGVVVHGNRLLVHGVKAASSLIDYAGLAAASVASVAVGDKSGEFVRGKGDVAAVGSRVAGISEKVRRVAEKHKGRAKSPVSE